MHWTEKNQNTPDDFTALVTLVANNFIKNLLMTKPRDCKSDLVRGHASRPKDICFLLENDFFRAIRDRTFISEQAFRVSTIPARMHAHGHASGQSYSMDNVRGQSQTKFARKRFRRTSTLRIVSYALLYNTLNTACT